MSFDCQKNLELPKIPDQDAYYHRQMYLYHFAVINGSSRDKISKDNSTSYLWTENVHKKGSNEIASCVYHSLQNFDVAGASKIRLFADACGGQNKNRMLLGMASKWVVGAPCNVKEVELIFPVRGHSFMLPDGLFGMCSKDFQKLEVVNNPDEYVNIISKYSKIVKVVSDECKVYDWKSQCDLVLRPTKDWHFKFAPCKRYITRRAKNNSRNVVVQGENFYLTDIGKGKCVTKTNKTVSDMHLKRILPNQPGLLKKAKLLDVANLLNIHYTQNWQMNPLLEFYKPIIVNNEQHADVNDEERQDEESVCENIEESPELCV